MNKYRLGKNVSIITIGDEILSGNIVDTNSAFLSRFFLRQGYRVTQIKSIGDDAFAITSALKDAVKKNDVVVITGGLGPTHDDITTKVLCKFFKCKKKFSPKVKRWVADFYRQKNRPVQEASFCYHEVPLKAEAFKNITGLAPALFFDKKVLALPGVPHETISIIKKYGKKLFPNGGRFVKERVIKTFGVGETVISGKIKNLNEVLKFASVAFLPHSGWVDLRITTEGKTKKEACDKSKKAEKLIKQEIKEYIWGFDDDRPEMLLKKKIVKKDQTLVVAESCTGGGIGSAITSVSGSSAYFLGGVLAYSDDVKMRELKVPKSILKKYGAVSREVAILMAKGARKKFKADWSLSATGVAGPNGGTKDKPIGLVYVAVSGEGIDECKELRLSAGREENRKRTIMEALFLLLTKL